MANDLLMRNMHLACEDLDADRLLKMIKSDTNDDHNYDELIIKALTFGASDCAIEMMEKNQHTPLINPAIFDKSISRGNVKMMKYLTENNIKPSNPKESIIQALKTGMAFNDALSYSLCHPNIYPHVSRKDVITALIQADDRNGLLFFVHDKIENKLPKDDTFDNKRALSTAIKLNAPSSIDLFFRLVKPDINTLLDNVVTYSDLRTFESVYASTKLFNYDIENVFSRVTPKNDPSIAKALIDLGADTSLLPEKSEIKPTVEPKDEPAISNNNSI